MEHRKEIVLDLPATFNNNSSPIVVPHTALADSKQKENNEFYFSFWIYITESFTGKRRVVLNKGYQDKDEGFTVELEAIEMRLRVLLNSKQRDTNRSDGYAKHELRSKPLLCNQWIHIVIIVKNTCAQLFTNSNQSSEISINSSKQFIQNTKPLEIGSRFGGLIGGVKVSLGRTLSPEEISTQYNNEMPKTPPDTAIKMQSEIKPLKSLKELELWEPGRDPLNIATVPINEQLASFRFAEDKSRVIHCHDMAGGYADFDKYSQGSYVDRGYNFSHWHLIDIFIYFSHARMAIPPPVWTNAAHKNGVKMLATFITEWEGGHNDNITLLDGPRNETLGSLEPSHYYADKMIDMAEYYGFDGWFLNIESKLPSAHYAQKMINFLKYMKEQLHKRIPESLLIWYDSVTINGELRWQNKLNNLNKPFFDASDGIFLNYNWNPEMLLDSVNLAGEDRKHDIYTGIDIWGRGTYGGGKFNHYLALDAIKTIDTSTALFAPGWTYEGKTWTQFLHNEAKFWDGVNVTDNLLKNKSLNDWNIIQNGGDGWKQIREGYNDEDGFVTSFMFCRRQQIINLLSCEKINSGFMDNVKPMITIESFFKGTGPNCKDLFYTLIELLDSNKNVLERYFTGEKTASDKWQNITHTFTNYPRGVRYIRWEDGGKDVEFWRGHFGTVISGSKILMETTDAAAVRSYYSPNPAIVTLPFVTNFNTGIGNNYYIHGKIVQSGSWMHLGEQDNPITHIIRNNGKSSNGIICNLSHNIGYEGGSCLEFTRSDSATLDAKRYVGLYHTSIFLDREEMPFTVSIVYGINSNNANEVNVGVHFYSEDESIFQLFSSSSNSETCILPIQKPELVSTGDHNINWFRITWEISPEYLSIGLVQLTEIGLQIQFSNNKSIKRTFIGNLSLTPGDAVSSKNEIDPKNSINDINYELAWNIESVPCGYIVADVNLFWKYINPEPVAYYNIYRFIDDNKSNGNNQYIYLGRAFTEKFVYQLHLEHDEKEAKFVIQPITTSGRSTALQNSNYITVIWKE